MYFFELIWTCFLICFALPSKRLEKRLLLLRKLLFWIELQPCYLYMFLRGRLKSVDFLDSKHDLVICNICGFFFFKLVLLYRIIVELISWSTFVQLLLYRMILLFRTKYEEKLCSKLALELLLFLLGVVLSEKYQIVCNSSFIIIYTESLHKRIVNRC